MIRASPLRRHFAAAPLQHQFRVPISRSTYAQSPRRLASTASGPNAKSSWKSFLLRLGLAGGAVYYYNTSPLFGNEAALPPLSGPQSPERAHPTLESLAPKRNSSSKATTPTSSLAIPSDIPTEDAPAPSTSQASSGSPAELEAEASQQGAFNEETGEINWDCPCLGGMAYGPCGAQFREAFSCFVFSEADPKGMDCVDKFKAMQDCFREHPDVYGAELEDDDEEPSAEATIPAPSEKSTDGLATQPQSNIRPKEQVEKAQQALGDASDAVKSKAGQIRDAVSSRVEDVGDVVREKTQLVKDRVADATQSAKSKAAEAEKTAEKKVESVSKSAQDKVEKVKDPRTSA